MVIRFEESRDLPPTTDRDERLGEAIETYLALAEQGNPPDAEAFATRHPDLREDILAALEGLELVHGLMGLGSGSGVGPGDGPGRRLESGRRIAGYRVVRELGRGGMGTVYEAVHVGLDRPVALKVLGTHAAPDSSARRRFLNEARTAAGLHHTHIVPVFDVGQAGGLCYYAMQRIEGSGLDRVVRHLRRDRASAASRNTAQGDRSFSPLDREPPSGSQFSSRFNRLWIRVSSNWRWHRPRPTERGGNVPGAVVADVLALLDKPRDRESARTSLPGPGERSSEPEGSSGAKSGPAQVPKGPPSPITANDSTASWGDADRRGESQLRNSDGGGSASLELALSGSTLASRHRDDEDAEPPFVPPRGSAYFRWVAEVGLQAAEALAHAHHQGVIHRDVKPSNLLIDARGTLWVTDFGLARRLADPGLTHHDSLLGTPRYMSPEQARTGTIDGRTDVYSLGATLYELLTLRPPFDGASAAELLDQIGGREPVPPRVIDRRIPRDLETIVLKSLSKRPADRYATAAALAEDLVRFLNREPVRARRISPVGRLWRVARRHPGITSVTTVASVTVLAVATYAYVRILGERNEANQARKQTETALLATENALRETKTARGRELASNAARELLSDGPNRRRIGLDLLQKASELGSAPGLKSELRDQAVRFLVLRDVESRPEVPTGSTGAIEFGPGGTLLAALSDDGQEINLWDTERRQRFETLSLSDGPKSAPAPGRDHVETGGGGGRSELGRQGEPASRSPAGSSRNSPGGRGRNTFGGNRLAVAGNVLVAIRPDDQGLRLFDAHTGSWLRDLDPRGHRVLGLIADQASQRLLSLELVPDKGPPTSAAEPEVPDPLPWKEIQVNLWDLERIDQPPTTLETFEPQRRGFPMAALSPDGKSVAIGAYRSATVTLYSALTGQRTGSIETQTEQLTAIALGANNLLATAAGSTIQFWDHETSTLLASLSCTRGTPWLMRFNPRGTLLAAAVGSNIEIWDAVSHRLIAVATTPDSSAQVSDLAFAPDGRTLAVGSRAAATFLWSVTDSAARTELSGVATRPISLAFGQDGTLAIGGWSGDVWFWRDGHNRCAASPPPKAVPSAPSGREFERGRERERRTWTSVTFDAAGRLLAHDSQGLRIWPAGSPMEKTPSLVRLVTPSSGPWGAHTLMARTTDGQVMALERSSELFIWRADQPEQVWPVIPPVQVEGERISSPASARALDGARPGPPPSGGEPRRSGPSRPRPPGPHYNAIQIAPRGDRLYLLAEGKVQTWALEDAAGRHAIRASRLADTDLLDEGISNFALRPDGRILAIADRSGNLRLFDTGRRLVVGEIVLSGRDLGGFPRTMVFSPDGRDLAIGSQQGPILLWSVSDPSAPRLRLRLPSHSGFIASLVFDPQGERLACARMDSLIEVWNLRRLHEDLARIGLDD